MHAFGAPLTLSCGVTLCNRIVKSAMSEALCDANNNSTQAHIDLFEHWGAGGAAVLITGNTPIDRDHLEHAGNFVLDAKSDMGQMRKLVRGAQAHGAKILAQLAHAGRQTPISINPAPLSISDVRLDLDGYGTPRVATDADLQNVIGKFVTSAKRAQEAGFDGVQIHAAHGYLLSSALSPRINTRNDQWGGSLENRARLVMGVVNAVRGAVARDFIVAVKLNSSDFQKGGFDHIDAVKVAKMLEGAGVDFIEISGGNFEEPTAYQHTSKASSTQIREAYFLEYAAAIKDVLSIPLMVTGGFRSASVMNAAIENGKTDLIGMGRPFITDPHFAGALLRGDIDRAPCIEETFPPAHDLPRGAVLNWFCAQLAILGQTGKPDLDLPVIDGHEQYLADIDRLTARLLRARAAISSN